MNQPSDQVKLHSEMETFIPLKIRCPLDCKCGDKNSYQWTHPQCDDADLFIDENGYIFCEKYKKDNTQCYKQFIQDFIFVCGENQTQYKNFSILFQSLEIYQKGKTDNYWCEFTNKLTLNVVNKWQC